MNTQGTINEPITTDREGSKEVGPGTWFLRCISQSLNPDGSAKILQSQEEICRLNLDLRERPAIYINLEGDVDKNENMQSMLKECGFNNIIRLNAERFPDRPLAGCSLSHYNALHEVDAPFIILSLIHI